MPTSTASPPSRRRKRLRCLGLFNLGLLAALGVHRWLNPIMPASGDGVPDSAAAQVMKHRVYASITPEDAAGFTRIDPANPGGWLLINKEPLQPLDEYQRHVRVRPTAHCRTIVIQPLGPIDEDQKILFEALRQYTSIFFQLPARIEPLRGVNVTAGWQRGTLLNSAGRGLQYDAEHLLFDFLAPRRPDDAIAYLGITMSDLWAGDANFVFGLGSPTHQAGVYSLCRYSPAFFDHARPPEARQADAIQALRRSCKVLNHEVGHIFGLGHCVFYHCSMNGANSLGEVDAEPPDYCPLCHRKLLWNIGFDAAQRYQQLIDFYRKHGMTPEAEWTALRLEQWRRVGARHTSAR